MQLLVWRKRVFFSLFYLENLEIKIKNDNEEIGSQLNAEQDLFHQDALTQVFQPQQMLTYTHKKKKGGGRELTEDSINSASGFMEVTEVWVTDPLALRFTVYIWAHSRRKQAWSDRCSQLTT